MMIKKILVLFLGLFITFAIFEITLRSIGIIDSYQRIANKESIPQKSIKILTLGNSYTYGSGAPKGMSYPDQLSRLLHQKIPNVFHVINRGLGNINTTFILENMPQWISENKPDVIFIMTGEPNHWNKYGFWKYLKKNNKTKKETFIFNVDFLRFFKVFRFIELLMYRIETWDALESNHYSSTFAGVKKETLNEKTLLGYLWIGSLEEGATFNIHGLTDSQIKEALEMITIISHKENNYLASRILAEIFLFKNNDPKKSLFYIEESLKQNLRFDYGLWIFVQKSFPFFTGDSLLKLKQINNILIGRIKNHSPLEILTIFKNDNYLRTQDNKELLQNLHKIHQYYPSKTKLISAFCELGSFLYPMEVLDAIFTNLKSNPLSSSADLLTCANNVIKLKPEYSTYFNSQLKMISSKNGLSHFKDMLNERFSTERWIISDLEDMIRIAKLNNIEVIIQNYPPYRHKGLREADRTLNHWWQNRKPEDAVTFMDINKSLEARFNQERNWEQYYSNEFGPTDNHLNERGYQIIAQEMYPIVLDLAKRRFLIVQ